jgi:hypothetical protein
MCVDFPRLGTKGARRPMNPFRASVVQSLLCALGGLALTLGCTTNSVVQECTADDGCQSGFQCRAGQCQRITNRADAGADAGINTADAGNTDGGGSADAAMQQGDAGGMGGACQHNDDGVLTSEELPLALGVEARFVAAMADGGIPVDLTGTVINDKVTWDLSAALPNDTQTTVVAEPLTGRWYADYYPAGQYAVALDGTGDTLGIYERTATEVKLLGVVSRTPDATRLTLNPPVVVLRFPLVLGQTFSTTTTNSGTLEGNAFYTSTDTYDFTVDGSGRLRTPAGEFSVLRVRVEQTASVPIIVFPFELNYRWVRYSFVAPCYSQVANISSVQGETMLGFTRAAEVRRLGLMP